MSGSIALTAAHATCEYAVTTADVWVVELIDVHSDIGALSTEERARAARFVFERDRRRYIAARGMLRRLLAQHLEQAPHEVALREGEHGRPYCPQLRSHDFNLSHSEDLAVIALGPEDIGVDIEVLRPMRDAVDLARHFFSLAEARAIEQLSGEARERAFLCCWTRKEAVLKAAGLGLNIPPSTVLTGVSDGLTRAATPRGDFMVQTVWLGERAVASIATREPVELRFHPHQKAAHA